jgi:hypothetical protein
MKICRSYPFLTKIKAFATHISGVRIIGGTSHSTPWLALTDLAYTIMVSVPTEEHNIHMHTSPLIPQVAPMRLTLHGQRCIRYKNVFTSCGSGHKIFPGLYSHWVHSRD